MADKKPRGWEAFSELARKLVTVPKQAVDDKIAQQKTARRARRKAK